MIIVTKENIDQFLSRKEKRVYFLNRVKDIAKDILETADRPLHQNELAQIAEEKQPVATKLKILGRDIRKSIRDDIKNNRDKSAFIEFDKRFFGLKGWEERNDIDMKSIKQKYHKKRRHQRFDKSGFTDIADHILLGQLKNEIRQIKTYLKGISDSMYSLENVCFWIWLCYRLDMYREAAMLFRRVSEDAVEKDLYKVTEKIALACEAKLRNE